MVGKVMGSGAVKLSAMAVILIAPAPMI